MLDAFTLLFFGLLMLDVVVMLLASRFWIFDLFINFIPQFLILGIVCLGLLISQGNILPAGILLGAMLYLGRALVELIRPARDESSRLGSKISILHANVNAKNVNYHPLLEMIRRHQPTLVTLNEVTQQWIDEVSAAFGATYPFVVLMPDSKYRGMAVFSRMPIASHEVFRPTEESSPLIRIHMKETPLIFYAAHPLPPMGKNWADQRDAFFNFFASEVNKVPGDLIIAGDLNVTLFSPLLRNFLMTTGLTLDRRGFGLKPSWMYGTPVALPIDHVLYRGALTMDDFKILGDIGSDHRPVLATFKYAR